MDKRVFPLKPDGRAPSPFEKGFYDMIGRYPTDEDRKKISQDQYRRAHPEKPGVWEQVLPVLAMGLGQAGGGALADSIFEKDGAINNWASGLFSGVGNSSELAERNLYNSSSSTPSWHDASRNNSTSGFLQGLISAIGGYF